MHTAGKQTNRSCRVLTGMDELGLSAREGAGMQRISSLEAGESSWRGTRSRRVGPAARPRRSRAVALPPVVPAAAAAAGGAAAACTRRPLGSMLSQWTR